MEKITFQLLIDHLREQADLYNQLYRETELKHGAVDGIIIAQWMTRVIEPVIRKTCESNPESLPRVFRAFYTELLQILGNRSGLIYEKEYTCAWLLCSQAPDITGAFPSRLIKAINSAVESIRMYQPDKVQEWIGFMNTIISHCDTIDEILAAGRIYAWLSGLAHLRDRAKEEFPALRPELKEMIEKSAPVSGKVEEALQKEWFNMEEAAFTGEAGGFTGYGGNFIAPPVVAQIGNTIVATDAKNTCAFFADTFGKVLLSEFPVLPERVVQAVTVSGLDNFKLQYGEALVPFEDVSSIVIKENTMVLTRQSSHYLYVYGWSA